MRRRLAVASVLMAAALLLAGCDRGEPAKPQSSEPALSLPASGKLGADHLKLLNAGDLCGVLARQENLDRTAELEDDETSAFVQFFHEESVYEVASYRADRVADIEADAREELRKARSAGFSPQKVTGLGAHAFCYEIKNVTTRPKVVVFWNTPQKLRVSVTAYEMPLQKAAELAGRMARRLPPQ